MEDKPQRRVNPYVQEAYRTGQTYEEMGQAKFERTCLQALYAMCKLPKQAKAKAFLTVNSMARFREVNSEFPVFLTAHVFREAKRQGRMDAFFVKDAGTPEELRGAYRRTLETYSGEAGPRAIAILFNWPYLDLPMVLHDCGIPESNPLYLSIPLGEQALVVQRLDSFAQEFLKSWVGK